MRSVLRRIRDNEGSPSRRRSASPAASAADRRRSSYADRLSRPQDSRRGRDSTNSLHQSIPESLHTASERLAMSNHELRSLLDRPVAGTRPASSAAHQMEESERRRKRRRLDSPEPPLHKVDYGYHGQVKAGNLNMEVVTADGGNLGQSHDLQASWSGLGLNAAENIFKDDRSVYAAGSRRSNLVLRHRDERSFTLSKITIEGPTPTSADALLEGLVFVSTKRDSAFDRTLQYQIHHYPTSHFGPRPTSPLGTGVTQSISALLRQARGSNIMRARDRPLIQPHQNECDMSSDSSDGDDTPRPHGGPTRLVFTDDPPSDSENSSGSSSRSISPVPNSGFQPGPPGYQRSYDAGALAETVARLHGRNARSALRDSSDYLNQDPDDHESALAQFDFDDVLRRGNVTVQDRNQRRRRRAAATRGRVALARQQREEQQEEQRQRWDRYMRQFTEDDDAGNLVDANDHRGEGSDLPGDEDYVLEELRAEADAENRAARGRRRASSPAPYGTAAATTNPLLPPMSHPPSIDLLPVTACFAAPCRRHGTRQRSIQHPASSTPAHTTPSPGVSVLMTRKHSGSRITLAFDPPIAARFVLLKLWKGSRRDADAYGSGADRGIEVQRVKVEGWCGPRFHPVAEMA